MPDQDKIDPGYVKIRFDVEDPHDPDLLDVETVWARPVEGGFLIDNIPFYAFGVACGDIVDAEPDEDGVLVFREVVEASGNSVLRFCFETEAEQKVFRAKLHELGCDSELMGTRVLAVDVPARVDFARVREWADEHRVLGRFEYEEACIGHPASLPPRARIDDFWAWFAGVSDQLAIDHSDPNVVAELDRRVHELGDIGWEIGPGLEAEHAFVLSPQGDADWLPVTRGLVAAAPGISGWELHPALPPKQWDLRFELDTVDGRTLEVEARPWRCAATRLPEGSFELVVEQSNLHGIDEDTRWTACAIVLDGIMGEANRIAHVADLQVVESLPERLIGEAGSIMQVVQRIMSSNGGTE